MKFLSAIFALVFFASLNLFANDGGKGTARETKRRLEKAELLSDGPGRVEIISSDPTPRSVELAWKLLNG